MKRGVSNRVKAGLLALAMVISQGVMPVQAAYAVHKEGEVHGPDESVSNAGDIKVTETGKIDQIPDTATHLESCSVTVEFYNFNNTTDLASTVSFTPQGATDGTIVISGDSTSPAVVGDGDNDGEGNNDLDGSYTYNLAFTGEPSAQGYHVDLDVNIMGTVGGSKQKIFWMPASCRAIQTEVTPAVIRIDECGVLNDSVHGVATDGITYTESNADLEYTVIAQPASDNYKIVVGDSGFVLNDDGSATYTTTVSNIDCEEEKDEIALPSGISDICGPRNDIVPMPKEEDYFSVKSDSQWEQDGEDLVKTIRTITYEADSGYVFIASEGWVLSEDMTIATYTFTDWGTKCPSENICTVDDNQYNGIWEYDEYSYPEADSWPTGGIPGNFIFQNDGLYISTPSEESYVMGLIDAGKTPLKHIDKMSYSTLRSITSLGNPIQVTAYVVYTDTDGNMVTTDDRMYFVYEPAYNGTVQTGTWQHWDVLYGGSTKWWGSDNSNPDRTWNQILAQYPEAIAMAYGFNQGTSNKLTNVTIQDVEFDCAVTTFGQGGGNVGIPPVVTPETPVTPVVDTPQQGQGATGVLPAELPMTGSGGMLSTWFALLAAILTYGAVLYLQPKKRLEE